MDLRHIILGIAATAPLAACCRISTCDCEPTRYSVDGVLSEAEQVALAEQLGLAHPDELDCFDLCVAVAEREELPDDHTDPESALEDFAGTLIGTAFAEDDGDGQSEDTDRRAAGHGRLPSRGRRDFRPVGADSLSLQLPVHEGSYDPHPVVLPVVETRTPPAPDA
jgi:hypothetical protein